LAGLLVAGSARRNISHCLLGVLPLKFVLAGSFQQEALMGLPTSPRRHALP
jgi:hypothetical protein